MTPTTPSAPDEVVLDEKALEVAHDAVREALGYRHGNMVNLAGILIDFKVIAAAAIRAYLRASPQPAGVTEEQAAYALLWRMHTSDSRFHDARRALLDIIGRDGQHDALQWAIDTFGPTAEPRMEEMP